MTGFALQYPALGYEDTPATRRGTQLLRFRRPLSVHILIGFE
jgi:hypothetical protein